MDVRRRPASACALDASAEPVATRLLALGKCGVGGFVDGGRDDEGVWLARRSAIATVDGLARGERKEWREAIAIVRDVARALAACEAAGLFPGALTPSSIALAPTVWIEARGLVDALVGAASAARDGSVSPRWTPPEQAAGAPWDNAANRYVLGLAAYRLLAGTHPFGGAGLRHAAREQASVAVPPFEDAIAPTMKPGVQSFVLSLLAADPHARPRDAATIAARCDALLREERPETDETMPPLADARRDEAAPARLRSPPNRVLAGAAPAPRAQGETRAPFRPLRTWSYVPIVAGAIAVVASFAGTSTPHVRAPTAAIAAAHLSGTTAADCAPCHARQVAEWERSVMAHATKSPLFGALESVVEEQVGRDARCPNGAGALRKNGGDVCRDEKSGIAVTGAGGEGWCVNCHAPGVNGGATRAVPAWTALGAVSGRAPLRDLLSPSAMEGISCAACHQTIGPVALHASRRAGAYEGNPSWTSSITGAVFTARPEDALGQSGISNSGYAIDASWFVTRAGGPRVHARPTDATARYLRSSEFCGACHDVRLFGSDVVGAAERGEHFKRLRNAYSEWRAWADTERRAGRAAASCADCHMTTYPGSCARGGGGDADCASGTHFERHAPGTYALARVASSSAEATRVAQHYFTSVDVPLSDAFTDAWADDTTLDGAGLPVGLRARRDILLRHTFRFGIGAVRRIGASIEIPIEIENTGAGHRVPAGFSQEREIWVELTVTDARGRVVYDVGKIASAEADLRDKVFARVTTDESRVDERGRPLGLFGADVVDGPDAPAWSPNPSRGGTSFRGRGLVNLQNGFLRCVRCIGVIDGEGHCQAAAGQGRTRADRYADGAYDLDTGECRSNLSGGQELFETYFPVGALDAERGIAKAPDAIIDTRSAPPGVPLTYTYVLDASGRAAPFTIEARLRFRSFPPFLVRAFAEYEARKAREGARPSGAQVTSRMLRRIDAIDLASARARLE